MVRMEKRPTTATLIKPTVLDTRLLGIFDMTTVSREHLIAIKNLVHSTPRCKCKSTISIMEAFAIDCKSAKVHEEDDEEENNNNNNNNNVKNIRVQKARKASNKTYRISRHRGKSNLADAEERQASSEERKPKVPCIPIPCATCGRQNQPERFHSHPSRRQVKAKEILTSGGAIMDERKTVQKPVPIKFRSAAKTIKSTTNAVDTKETPTSKSEGRRGGVGRPHPPPHYAKPKEQKLAKNSDVTTAGDDRPSVDQPDKENTPKIKNNWKEARRKMTPQQPKPINDDHPSSKVKASNVVKTPRYEAYKLDTWIPAPVSGERKRKVVCNLCSREFGTTLLPSHEAQCIQQYLGEIGDNGDTKNEKGEIENQKEIPSAQAKENWKLAWELTQTVLIACKCCGRKFLPSRVEAHQKICSLKSNFRSRRLTATRPSKLDVKCCESSDKWSSARMVTQTEEPTKLEHSKRRNQSPPTLPRSMFDINNSRRMAKAEMNTSNDEKEHKEAEYDTVEVFWKAHQAQLVPCTNCARTFYPHRLEVHLRGCKETSTHHERKLTKVNNVR